MQEGLKNEGKVPIGELLDYDGGSYAMEGIPNTRNEPHLMGPQ